MEFRTPGRPNGSGVARSTGLCLATALLLGLAGCDPAPAPERSPPTKITNPYHEQLEALPGDLQRLGLMRAIRDNGKRCKRVEAGRYQQDYRQMALWVATCEDERSWAIFIAPNGDTQVRECGEMRQLDLPLCQAAVEADAAPR